MNQIKIKATIDADNASQVAAACTFLHQLGQEQNATADPAEAKPAAKRTRKPAAKKIEENPPEAEKTEAKETSSITVESIRALLSTKVNDHRAEIKAKLTKLNANNVTALDESHYEAFTEFLSNLD